MNNSNKTRSSSKKQSTASDNKKRQANSTPPQNKKDVTANKNVKAKPTKSQSPSKTRYTKFNNKVTEQHELFEKYISIDLKNNKRFKCSACEDQNYPDSSGYYDYLGNHFLTSRLWY